MQGRLFMAAQPIGARRTSARDSTVADEACPVWQRIGSRHAPRRKFLSQCGPRFLRWGVSAGDLSHVQQYRLTSFLNGKAA